MSDSISGMLRKILILVIGGLHKISYTLKSGEKMKIDFATGLILICVIISIGSIGQCAFAIWLYHRDGGTKSTKNILRDALNTFFAPLILTLKWVVRL